MVKYTDKVLRYTKTMHNCFGQTPKSVFKILKIPLRRKKLVRINIIGMSISKVLFKLDLFLVLPFIVMYVLKHRISR